MRESERPKIGTKMWDIHENLYYVPNHAGPVMEYVVTEGEVTGYFEGGYTEIKLSGPVPRGNNSFPVPRFHKLSDIGKRVFFTSREAALKAKEMTEKHEQTWAWTNEPPLRRTWEKYLEQADAGRAELHDRREEVSAE